MGKKREKKDGQRKTTVDEIADRVKSHRLLAWLVIIALAVAGLEPVLNLLDRIRAAFARVDQSVNGEESPRSLPSAVVSVDCSPEVLPLSGKQGESLYAVFLHPQWGNRLIKTLFRTGPAGEASVWPEIKGDAVGYQCQIRDEVEEPVSVISMQLQVTFRSGAASHTSRLIQISLPDQLSKETPFILHIADDTGWDPLVTLPDQIEARMRNHPDAKSIRVHYSTKDGRPPRLGGFGPAANEPPDEK